MPGWAALKHASEEDIGVFGDATGGPAPAFTAPPQAASTNNSQSRGTSPELESWVTSPLQENQQGSQLESYVISGAPPPCGQTAPKTPNEFLNITVFCARKNPDATGKDVVWYDMSIRTATHQWQISKRFSDLVQFHTNLKKLQLDKYRSEISSAVGAGASEGASSFPPPFPSKFHLRGNHSPALIEERRMQLDAYWRGVLAYLQGLTLAAIGFKKPYHAALRAAFALMVDCVRSSSQSELSEAVTGPWAKEDPYASPPRGSSSAAASSSPLHNGSPSRHTSRSNGALGSPVLSSSKGVFSASAEVDVHPPCKIVLDPNYRFTIMFLLPGVLLGDIYVDATGERDRSVIVGGKWNTGITGLEGLREQGVFQTSSEPNGDTARSRYQSSARRPQCSERGGTSDASGSRSPPKHTVGSGGRPVSARPREARATLMDTFPRGSFELVFDVPHPFERAHWYSEYEAGVLLIMWDAPPS